MIVGNSLKVKRAELVRSGAKLPAPPYPAAHAARINRMYEHIVVSWNIQSMFRLR